jgi:hypothetical protein
MSRVETILGRKWYGGASVPKTTANMSVVSNGAYINYYPSPAAVEIAKKWPRGYKAAWDIDDESGQPVTVHLMPSVMRGFVFRIPKNQRPHFVIPTSDVGPPDLDNTRLQPVEELTISDQEISAENSDSAVNEVKAADITLATASAEVANDVG